MNKSNDDMKAHISRTAKLFYQQPAKSLQVDAVLNLVNGQNTFLLAGTGFGKSRIPEIYSMMLPCRNKAIVLTLNPLDTLGDNQVEEKIEAGFTAINLNKMNFNQTTADKIANGNYQFIYLSPEIFLNNKIWEDVYFSSAFQNRLSLVVIDKAHMIYMWGLVKSGPGKHLAKMYGRQQDVGIFRPSYGNLGGQLQSRNNIPILLLSATCRPIAVKAIKESLRLDDSEIDILRGELTWPEI
jgi:superfamily II DNA helicase RecQ